MSHDLGDARTSRAHISALGLAMIMCVGDRDMSRYLTRHAQKGMQGKIPKMLNNCRLPPCTSRKGVDVTMSQGSAGVSCTLFKLYIEQLLISINMQRPLFGSLGLGSYRRVEYEAVSVEIARAT